MSRKRDSVLWELSFPNSTKKSYVFGTMHVQDSFAFSHLEKALKYQGVCQVMACEYNLDLRSNIQSQHIFLNPSGQGLSELYGPRLFKKLNNASVKYFDIDLHALQSVLPFGITSMLTSKLLSNDYAVNLDQHLWDSAIKQNMEREGLELFEDQLTILSSIDMQFQLKQLKDILLNYSKYAASLKDMCTLYEQEKIHALYQKSKKSLGRYKKLLLFNRNEQMANSIIEISSQKTLFAAVGAAHLSGDKGVLHLLNQKGVKIKPC